MSNTLNGPPRPETPASDEVVDAIAEIEVTRRGTQKEAGLAASCSAALRKLHELLDREKEALQQPGPAAGQPGNIEAVTIEIERVKALGVVTGQGPAPRHSFPSPQKASWQDARRNPGRNKGRRTMGRAGGR